jgi:hypothetical protein
MELIKTLNRLPIQINEDSSGSSGATGSSTVASTSMPLFKSLVKRISPTHPRVLKLATLPSTTITKKLKLGISEAFHMLEDLSPDRNNQNFDASEIISKLKSLEDKESVNYKDTVTFGLVDNNGGIVKVSIPKDQATSFEQDIQHMMGEYEEDESTPEIAEILFNLKNNYTIVDVEWPDVEEDAEDSASTLEPGAEGGLPGEEGGLPGEEGGLPGEEEALPGEEEALPGAGTEPGVESVTSLLTQVIDMMKTDADARKAEAQAREAEFKTRQSVAARDQAMARVKQEEQMLDMDEYNKSKKEREKESKKLAQLAKWKHDISSGKDQERPAQEPSYDFLPGDENEEYAKLGNTYSAREDEEHSYKRPTPQYRPSGVQKTAGKVIPSDIAKFIMNRVK